MTIAFTFEIFLPVIHGVFTATHDLATNLIARGHRVVYIAPRWPESKITDVDGIPVYYISSYETFVYPGMRNVIPWSRHVERVLVKENVDVVHITGPWLLNWATLRAGRRRGCATVQTFHTMLQEPTYIRYFTHTDLLVAPLRMAAWKYFGIYIRRSDIVTGPSRYVVDELSKHYPDQRIEYVPNGIDLDDFADPPTIDSVIARYPDFRERSIVFVGRLGEEKAVDKLIDAARIAVDLDPEFRLLIVGDGPGRRRYQNQVRRLGLADHVFFLGRIPHRDLITSGLLHHARANVTASTTESFGMTVVEAMAAGTPSIVANVPGISELTVGTGLTFKKGDLRDFAEKMVLLFRDDDLFTTLRAGCREHARRFDGRQIAEHFEALYESIHPPRRRRSRGR